MWRHILNNVVPSLTSFMTPKERGNTLTIHVDTKTKPLYGCLALLLKPNLYSLTY